MLIKEFKFDIFPLRLWVCTIEHPSQLNAYFIDSDGDPLGLEVSKAADCFVTEVCIKKRDGSYGVVVAKMENVKVPSKVFAHEACHVADKLWKWISEDTRGSEANAYVVEWVFDKIEKVYGL